MRRLVGAILGLIVLLAASSALWTYTSEESASPKLVLAEVEGEVQISGPGRAEAAAIEGTVLAARDRVRTLEGSRAVLELGQDTKIRLGPTSSIAVQAVDEDGVRLELEDGALRATVRPESAGAVRVSSGGREVLATNAEFEVGVRDGVLQVDALVGDVALSGVDETKLSQGMQATIVDRQTAVGPVPESVLLDIEWPEVVRTRAAMTVVTGRTAPGARVRVVPPSGAPVQVVADRTGTFRAEVPLVEGNNPVKVEAVDILGHVAAVEGQLETRDTVGPSFRGGVQYGN